MFQDLHDPRWDDRGAVNDLADELGIPRPHPHAFTVGGMLWDYVQKYFPCVYDPTKPDYDAARAAGVDTLTPRRLRRTRSTGQGSTLRERPRHG